MGWNIFWGISLVFIHYTLLPEKYLKNSHYDCTNIEKLSCENRAVNKINTPPERISSNCVIISVVGSGKKSKDYFWGDYHFKEVNQPYLKKLWGSL